MTRIAVLDYGMGNLRSVARAIERVGGHPVVTERKDEALAADAMVVPGVGAFGACMEGLRRTTLDDAVREFAATDRLMLGVCLGMQVLFERSEEGSVAGLGLVRGSVVRLPGGVKIPHMGWNEVRWTREHPLTSGIPSGTRFYFVHSYACFPEDDLIVGEAEHGIPFPAAIASGQLFATQFHPEKSGDAGIEIYRNLVKEAS